MIALIILLCVLVLLALMPVGVRALFDGALTVYLTLFGVSFRIYPQPKRTKKKPKKAKKDSKNTQKSPKKTVKNASLTEYLQLLTQLLGKLKRKLLLKELTLHAIFGGSEPELNYGRAWAAIGIIMPLFEQLFRIRKRDVGAYFDKDEESIRFYARAHATLTVFNILQIALHALRGYLRIKNNKPEKAVQTHE